MFHVAFGYKSCKINKNSNEEIIQLLRESVYLLVIAIPKKIKTKKEMF